MLIKNTAMWVLPVFWLLLSQASLAANLYRYTNDEGVTVVDYQVPAAYVSRDMKFSTLKGWWCGLCRVS